MNNECLSALRKYYDKDSSVFKKKLHYQWIEENFSASDIENCKNIIRVENKHTDEVVKGTAYSGGCVVHYDSETNNYYRPKVITELYEGLKHRNKVTKQQKAIDKLKAGIKKKPTTKHEQLLKDFIEEYKRNK